MKNQINPKDIKVDLVDVDSNYGEEKWWEPVLVVALGAIVIIGLVTLVGAID